MGAILSALLSVALKGVLSLFGVNRDIQIGALTKDNKDKDAEIKDLKNAKALDNNTDNLSPADLEQLRSDLNKRD